AKFFSVSIHSTTAAITPLKYAIFSSAAVRTSNASEFCLKTVCACDVAGCRAAASGRYGVQRYELRCRRRHFGGRFVKVMMTPPSMPLFALLKFLALFICEIDSYLPVRFSHELIDALAGVAPALP